MVDTERGFRFLVSLLESRTFALGLLFSALVSLGLYILFLNGTSFVVSENIFQALDLYKISLFAKGISPYSTEPWAAPYPPFYFAFWSLPYYVLNNLFRLSASGVYNGLRILSAIFVLLAAYAIYRNLLIQGKASIERAISLSALFLLCSLVSLIVLVGDSAGLLLLAAGCIFFSLNKSWIGVTLVTLSVAFKVHPVFGLILLLAALYYKRNSTAVKESFLACGVASFLTIILPLALLPSSWSAFIQYDAGNIQYYTFNVFAGLLDLAHDLLPDVGISNLSLGVDALWALSCVVILVLFLRILARDALIKKVDPIDLIALGLIMWFIVLKQTMPHYFLWMLVPLLARGRVRSTVYVLAAETFGFALFELGIGFTTNFFTTVQPAYIPPGIVPSLTMFAGGVIFLAFVVLAARELLKEIRYEALSTPSKEKPVAGGLVEIPSKKE